MNYFDKIIRDIEEHSVEGIKDCFANGISPNDQFNAQPLIYELTSEYARTPAFKDCVRAFVDHGLVFGDEVLLAVLLDDGGLLENFLRQDPEIINNVYSLRCAYTPLENVGLMHICAEFNHIACAEVLLQYGTDINSKAGTDANGFGGQTPVFHTVNQNSDNSAKMLELLLAHNADLQISLRGLTWGKGYPWETFIPSVNPISYAMMGLLPQMHRKETTIASTISRLLKAAYGLDYTLPNIPNKYVGH